jgi:hypothetical protein
MFTTEDIQMIYSLKKYLCNEIEQGINELEKNKEVKISKDKTEIIFRNVAIWNGNRRLECFRINEDGKEVFQ